MAEDELSLLSANCAITALVAWAVAVFAVCMCMFLVLDSSKQMTVLGVVQIPTLSLTGAYQPMQAIFTLGLSWMSVGTALIFNLVYFHLEGKIDDADRAAACSPSLPPSSAPSRPRPSPSGRSHHLRSAASSESLSNNDNGTACGDLNFVSVSSANLPPDEHQHRQRQEQQRDAIPPPARPLLPPLCCFIFTRRSCHLWNLLLWGIGMIFSVFMALVGTIPLTLNETGHGTVAIIMFIAGVVHLVLYHFSIAPLDRPCAGAGPPLAVVQKMSRQTSVRCIALGLIVPLNVCILITIFVTFLSCDTKQCREYVVQMLVGKHTSTVDAFSLIPLTVCFSY